MPVFLIAKLLHYCLFHGHLPVLFFPKTELSFIVITPEAIFVSVLIFIYLFFIISLRKVIKSIYLNTILKSKYLIVEYMRRIHFYLSRFEANFSFSMCSHTMYS